MINKNNSSAALLFPSIAQAYRSPQSLEELVTIREPSKLYSSHFWSGLGISIITKLLCSKMCIPLSPLRILLLHRGFF